MELKQSFYLSDKALNQALYRLKRKGKFWQKDSYDHFIRDEKELTDTINYIAQNPVKAGLVKSWEYYAHTYVSNGEFIRPDS